MTLMMMIIVNNAVAIRNQLEQVFFCDDCDVDVNESEVMEVFEGTHFCPHCNEML